MFFKSLNGKCQENNIRFAMAHGFVDGKGKIVEELNIGNRRIPNAPIDISSDDSILGPDKFLLGMGCFEDTIIVLDFEHNLFLVKQQTDTVNNNYNP